MVRKARHLNNVPDQCVYRVGVERWLTNIEFIPAIKNGTSHALLINRISKGQHFVGLINEHSKENRNVKYQILLTI